MKPTNAQIRQFITTTFNDSELETFCFDYFPEVKYTWGMELEFSHKVEQLIGYCQRRDLEANLLTNLQQERPQPFAAQFSTKVETPHVVATKPRNSRQIFISYAHDDVELAQRLAQDLEAEGWPVWIAPDSIRPGEKWASAISRGLDESGIFVLLLTPHAVKSRWVRHETDVAVEMEHEGEMRFIPLLVEPCRIPALWRAYQRISFRGGYEASFSTLLEALVMGKLSKFQSKEPVFKPAPPPPTPLPKNSFIHEKTGLEFVRVPAGEFLYGENKEKKYLPEFWMGKTPVTNEAYARFVKEKGYKPPWHWEDGRPPKDKLNHPVVYVSWHDTQAFCEWAGLQLPSEEEWEKAARGKDGREYPWGNSEPTSELCNFGRNEGGTTPVGKYSPQGDSPYGCEDMSGNVWEWTGSDREGGGKVLRGGSYDSAANRTGCSVRYWNDPGYNFDLGVRVAVSPSTSGL